MRFIPLFLLSLLLVLPFASVANAQEPGGIYCSIEVQPSHAKAGEPVSVTWKTDGATHLFVSSLVDLPTDASLSDSVTVMAPTESYLFSLIAQNAAGERVTCTDLLSVPSVVQTNEHENISSPRPCGPGIPDPHCHIDRFPDPHPPIEYYPKGYVPEYEPI